MNVDAIRHDLLAAILDRIPARQQHLFAAWVAAIHLDAEGDTQ